MTAITEAAIERAIKTEAATDGVGKYTDNLGDLHGNLTGLVTAVAGPLVESAAYASEAGTRGVFEPWRDPDPVALWTDLQPSEARRLAELVAEAMDAASRDCEAIIIEAMTEAGVRFAQEFPEVPRP